MKWRADLLAWANNAGVKVHDMKTDKGIAFIERPKGIPRPEFLLPHLVWQVNNMNGKSLYNPPTYQWWITSPPELQNKISNPLTFAKPDI